MTQFTEAEFKAINDAKILGVEDAITDTERYKGHFFNEMKKRGHNVGVLDKMDRLLWYSYQLSYASFFD